MWFEISCRCHTLSNARNTQTLNACCCRVVAPPRRWGRWMIKTNARLTSNNATKLKKKTNSNNKSINFELDYSSFVSAWHCATGLSNTSTITIYSTTYRNSIFKFFHEFHGCECLFPFQISIYKYNWVSISVQTRSTVERFSAVCKLNAYL